jgi:hypothetical protein
MREVLASVDRSCRGSIKVEAARALSRSDWLKPQHHYTWGFFVEGKYGLCIVSFSLFRGENDVEKRMTSCLEKTFSYT